MEDTGGKVSAFLQRRARQSLESAFDPMRTLAAIAQFRGIIDFAFLARKGLVITTCHAWIILT